jgi:hypothetical protein
VHATATTATAAPDEASPQNGVISQHSRPHIVFLKFGTFEYIFRHLEFVAVVVPQGKIAFGIKINNNMWVMVVLEIFGLRWHQRTSSYNSVIHLLNYIILYYQSPQLYTFLSQFY